MLETIVYISQSNMLAEFFILGHYKTQIFQILSFLPTELSTARFYIVRSQENAKLDLDHFVEGCSCTSFDFTA